LADHAGIEMENQMLQLEKAADCHASEGYWGFSAMLWQ